MRFPHTLTAFPLRRFGMQKPTASTGITRPVAIFCSFVSSQIFLSIRGAPLGLPPVSEVSPPVSRLESASLHRITKVRSVRRDRSRDGRFQARWVHSGATSVQFFDELVTARDSVIHGDSQAQLKFREKSVALRTSDAIIAPRGRRASIGGIRSTDQYFRVGRFLGNDFWDSSKAFSKPMDTRLMTRSAGQTWYMPLVGLMLEDSFSRRCS